MDAKLYENEYLRNHQRPLTQADLRIALVLTTIALVLANLIA